MLVEVFKYVGGDLFDLCHVANGSRGVDDCEPDRENRLLVRPLRLDRDPNSSVQQLESPF